MFSRQNNSNIGQYRSKSVISGFFLALDYLQLLILYRFVQNSSYNRLKIIVYRRLWKITFRKWPIYYDTGRCKHYREVYFHNSDLSGGVAEWLTRLTSKPRIAYCLDSNPVRGKPLFSWARNFTLIAKYWLVQDRIRMCFYKLSFRHNQTKIICMN
jgi:hypothetical protein